MAMASLIVTLIDSALHDIELLLVNHPTRPMAYQHIFEVLIFRLRKLKKFVQICGKERSFTSISTGIEETVRGCAEQIYLCCQDPTPEFYELTEKCEGDIVLMGEKIDEWCYNRKSSTSLTPDAVQDIISFIFEALVEFRRVQRYDHLYKAIDDLEEQMSFMKRLISYLATKISGKSIQDLLAHAEFVTFTKYGAAGSDISIFLVNNLEPVYETYTRALSSLKLWGDDGIDSFIAIKDFVDSLISNLWDLLRRLYSWTTFTPGVRSGRRRNFETWMISTQDVQELYGGLRSLRTVLKQPNNFLSMKIKQDIGKAVCGAGVFICSLHHRQQQVHPGLLENLLGTINNILETVATNEPGVPMLNVFEFSPADDMQEKQEERRPAEGVSLSTNEAVCFEEDEEVIVDQLKRGSRQLKIVAVVGMPGLGKTTLATKVFNNPSISLHFHVRAFCPISQLVDKKKVVLDILHQIDPSVSSRLHEEDLADALRKSLKGRRYLIFLDDMWDIEAWTLLEKSFPDDNVGSRIIMTSRRHDVAPRDRMADGKPYFLRQFNEEESLNLLQMKLSFELSLDLKMKIVEKCRGLPLILVRVAGVLKHAEPESWDELLDRLSNESIMEQCRNTLELSYMQLPDYLKPCLLYFGTFLENQEVSVRRLLRLWIAEGFVLGDDINSPDNYLNDLIGRSLIMVAKERSLGGAKTCRIHDLIRGFCVQKAKDEHLIHFLRGYDELLAFNEPPNLQRLCIHSDAEHFKLSKLFCPHACSLILNSSESTHTLIEGIAQRCLSHAFSVFKRLKVLDLEQVHFGFKFPAEIEDLVQLTFLAILCEESDIPSWIGNLSNLETLVILGDSGGTLPHSLWSLQKLQYLYFGGRGYILLYISWTVFLV